MIKSNIIEEDLPEQIGEIAVCNIDVDMYEAVGAALRKVKDHMVAGGILIAEDYGHTPALIRAMAATEYFYEGAKDEFYGFYMQSGQFIMIKK